jgi:hypothetical protein
MSSSDMLMSNKSRHGSDKSGEAGDFFENVSAEDVITYTLKVDGQITSYLAKCNKALGSKKATKQQKSSVEILEDWASTTWAPLKKEMLETVVGTTSKLDKVAMAERKFFTLKTDVEDSGLLAGPGRDGGSTSSDDGSTARDKGKTTTTTTTSSKQVALAPGGDSTVAENQRMLEKAGFSLAPYGADGKFGDTTSRQLKAFQQKNGLMPTGMFDATTVAKLRSLTGGGAAGDSGSSLGAMFTSSTFKKVGLVLAGVAVVGGVYYVMTSED